MKTVRMSYSSISIWRTTLWKRMQYPIELEGIPPGIVSHKMMCKIGMTLKSCEIIQLHCSGTCLSSVCVFFSGSSLGNFFPIQYSFWWQCQCLDSICYLNSISAIRQENSSHCVRLYWMAFISKILAYFQLDPCLNTSLDTKCFRILQFG